MHVSGHSLTVFSYNFCKEVILKSPMGQQSNQASDKCPATGEQIVPNCSLSVF